jgi:tRNA-dihydrouridine synthase B
MIGRAAQGYPWIFREVAHFLATGTQLAPPLVSEVKGLLVEHLHDHYSLYDEFIGVRSARKHIGWYLRELPGGEAFRQRMNLLEDSVSQVAAVAQYLDDLNEKMDRIPARGTVAKLAREQDMMELAA